MTEMGVGRTEMSPWPGEDVLIIIMVLQSPATETTTREWEHIGLRVPCNFVWHI